MAAFVTLKDVVKEYKMGEVTITAVSYTHLALLDCCC